MKKKCLSLFLVLTMMVSLFVNMNVVSAEDSISTEGYIDNAVYLYDSLLLVDVIMTSSGEDADGWIAVYDSNKRLITATKERITQGTESKRFNVDVVLPKGKYTVKFMLFDENLSPFMNADSKTVNVSGEPVYVYYGSLYSATNTNSPVTALNNATIDDFEGFVNEHVIIDTDTKSVTASVPGASDINGFDSDKYRIGVDDLIAKGSGLHEFDLGIDGVGYWTSYYLIPKQYILDFNMTYKSGGTFNMFLYNGTKYNNVTRTTYDAAVVTVNGIEYIIFRTAACDSFAGTAVFKFTAADGYKSPSDISPVITFEDDSETGLFKRVEKSSEPLNIKSISTTVTINDVVNAPDITNPKLYKNNVEIPVTADNYTISEMDKYNKVTITFNLEGTEYSSLDISETGAIKFHISYEDNRMKNLITDVTTLKVVEPEEEPVYVYYGSFYANRSVNSYYPLTAMQTAAQNDFDTFANNYLFIDTDEKSVNATDATLTDINGFNSSKHRVSVDTLNELGSGKYTFTAGKTSEYNTCMYFLIPKAYIPNFAVNTVGGYESAESVTQSIFDKNRNKFYAYNATNTTPSTRSGYDDAKVTTINDIEYILFASAVLTAESERLMYFGNY